MSPSKAFCFIIEYPRTKSYLVHLYIEQWLAWNKNQDKKGQWTAHLEGFFLPPNDGFYSFLITSSHKARLFFAESGCKMDAEVVATVSDSSNYQDFFSDKERLIMQKIELKKGQPYYEWFQ